MVSINDYALSLYPAAEYITSYRNITSNRLKYIPVESFTSYEETTWQKYESLWEKILSENELDIDTMLEHNKYKEKFYSFDILELAHCFRFPIIHMYWRYIDTPSPRDASFIAMLHLYNILLISGQKEKSEIVYEKMMNGFKSLSEEEVSRHLNNYLEKLVLLKPNITVDKLCGEDMDPKLKLLIRRCYCEMLIRNDQYDVWIDYLLEHADYFLLMKEKIFETYSYETSFKVFQVLACLHIYTRNIKIQSMVCHFEKIVICKLEEHIKKILQNTSSDEADVERVYRDLLSFEREVNYDLKNSTHERAPFLVMSMNKMKDLLLHHSIEHMCKMATDKPYCCQNEINKIACFVKLLCQSIYKSEQKTAESIIKGLTKLSNETTLHILAYFILEINSVQCKGDCSQRQSANDLLEKITKGLWKSSRELRSYIIIYECIQLIKNTEKDARIQGWNVLKCEAMFEFKIKHKMEIQKEFEMKKKAKLILVFVILLFITCLCSHKSAELKKYLTLKYEYDNAILSLLWCSGDIEINPGPPLKKNLQNHNSERLRSWFQDISPILLKLYWELNCLAKHKNLWTRKPDHWPASKPFYDTKNKSKDENGRFISDEDLMKCLLDCCKKKKITIDKIYQDEIAAWEQKKFLLLFKLYAFRTESTMIRKALQNIIPIQADDDTTIVLNEQHITIYIENDATQRTAMPQQRSRSQAEKFASITRDLSGTLCKIVKGKDPESKCDGIWENAPDNWPADVPFFNPYNRGKYKEKCSDKKLLTTFLNLPQLKIPDKYQPIMDAYNIMLNSGNIAEQKKNQLCKIYTMNTEIPMLDNALSNLFKEGIFTAEIYHILSQWWINHSIDNTSDQTLLQSTNIHRQRPHISIKIAKDCITISTGQTATVTYQIPFVQCTAAENPCNSVSSDSINIASNTFDTNFSSREADTVSSFPEIVIPDEAMSKLIELVPPDYDFTNLSELDESQIHDDTKKILSSTECQQDRHVSLNTIHITKPCENARSINTSKQMKRPRETDISLETPETSMDTTKQCPSASSIDVSTNLRRPSDSGYPLLQYPELCFNSGNHLMDDMDEKFMKIQKRKHLGTENDQTTTKKPLLTKDKREVIDDDLTHLLSSDQQVGASLTTPFVSDNQNNENKQLDQALKDMFPELFNY